MASLWTLVVFGCIAALAVVPSSVRSIPTFLSQAVAAAEDASQENLSNVKLEDKFGYCPRRCSEKARNSKMVQYPVCMNRCICSAYCDYSMSEGGLTSGNYRLCVGLCVLADPYSENPQTWDRDPSCCPNNSSYQLTADDKEHGCMCVNKK